MNKEVFSRILDKLKAGNIEDLETLRETLPNFPHGQDSFIERLWIVNAIDSGSSETVRWMLSKNVELNHRDDEGLTPIHSCIQSDLEEKYELLSLLIKTGADIHIRGQNTYTPLHLAAVLADQKAMEILLSAGADQTIKTTIDDCATPEEEARIMGRNEAVITRLVLVIHGANLHLSVPEDMFHHGSPELVV